MASDRQDDRLMDYLYGEMDAEEAARFEQDLERDSSLRQELDDAQSVLLAYRAAPASRPPAQAAQAALAAARAEHPPARGWLYHVAFHPAMAAAALIMVLVMIHVLLQSEDLDQTSPNSRQVFQEMTDTADHSVPEALSEEAAADEADRMQNAAAPATAAPAPAGTPTPHLTPPAVSETPTDEFAGAADEQEDRRQRKLRNDVEAVHQPVPAGPILDPVDTAPAPPPAPQPQSPARRRAEQKSEPAPAAPPAAPSASAPVRAPAAEPPAETLSRSALRLEAKPERQKNAAFGYDAPQPTAEGDAGRLTDRHGGLLEQASEGGEAPLRKITPAAAAVEPQAEIAADTVADLAGQTLAKPKTEQEEAGNLLTERLARLHQNGQHQLLLRRVTERLTADTAISREERIRLLQWKALAEQALQQQEAATQTLAELRDLGAEAETPSPLAGEPPPAAAAADQ